MSDDEYVMGEVRHRLDDEKNVEKVREALTVTGVIDGRGEA